MNDDTNESGAVPPPWAPPGEPRPAADPPTAPTTPVPPTWGPPTGPTSLGGIASPPGPPPPPGQQFGPADQSAPPPAPPSSTGRAIAVVAGLVVLLLLVVGGVMATVVVLSGSGGDLELTIEECEIAADGQLRATGSVLNDDAGTREISVSVTFSDVATGEQVDAAEQRLAVPGEAAERWSLEGRAGDEVERVNCDVTAEPT